MSIGILYEHTVLPVPVILQVKLFITAQLSLHPS